MRKKWASHASASFYWHLLEILLPLDKLEQLDSLGYLSYLPNGHISIHNLIDRCHHMDNKVTPPDEEAYLRFLQCCAKYDMHIYIYIRVKRQLPCIPTVFLLTSISASVPNFRFCSHCKFLQTSSDQIGKASALCIRTHHISEQSSRTASWFFQTFERKTCSTGHSIP